MNARRTSEIVRTLTSAPEPTQAWLEAVARLVVERRPDLGKALLDVIGVAPCPNNLLADLTMGQLAACYEALLASQDVSRRKQLGQFFTPDDVAEFMVSRTQGFGTGTWLDPCCGVGNLSWHLAANQPDPSAFVGKSLTMSDIDPTALRTAVALVSADFAGPGQTETVRRLAERCQATDFLASDPGMPYDFAICNPPYAPDTSTYGNLFASFMQRLVSESRGFVIVTPASYLSARRFAGLRTEMDRRSGGEVFVFDNIPDTLFRGYKHGSDNTSTTNFVRAAVTVCAPNASAWEVTQILRWKSTSRTTMFDRCPELLGARHLGPGGQWAKVGAHLEPVWRELNRQDTVLADLVCSTPTEYWLEVASTPRYYISASMRHLARGSKIGLYFSSGEDRDRAALALNSSIPYLWWRFLDGGVTLTKSVLLSTPIPPLTKEGGALMAMLRASENESVVSKTNAGKVNENIKHPPSVVDRLNRSLIPNVPPRLLTYTYASDQFSAQ